MQSPPSMRIAPYVAAAVALWLSSSVCGALYVLRYERSGELAYWFMPWNLFLAWLPMLFALAAVVLLRTRMAPLRIAGVGFAVLWLLFFPNAPYVATDMVHFGRHAGVPVWYDALLMASFVSTGVTLGLVSLHAMQAAVARYAGAFASWAFAFGSIGLAALGIYLGRVLRWNSWDALQEPTAVARDVIAVVREPSVHADAWVMMAIVAAGMTAGYLILWALSAAGGKALRA